VRFGVRQLKCFAQRREVVSREIREQGANKSKSAIGPENEGAYPSASKGFGEKGEIERCVVGYEYPFPDCLEKSCPLSRGGRAQRMLEVGVCEVQNGPVTAAVDLERYRCELADLVTSRGETRRFDIERDPVGHRLSSVSHADDQDALPPVRLTADGL
jgi:hypothetical protein